MHLENNNHSVFIMKYRLILAIRDRREVINDSTSARVRTMFEDIAPSYNISLTEWKYYSDHIDVIFKAEPNTELSKFINAYKSASSRVIKKEYPEIIPNLWNEYFWARSFCLMSIGELQDSIVQEYLETQKEIRKYRRKQNDNSD